MRCLSSRAPYKSTYLYLLLYHRAVVVTWASVVDWLKPRRLSQLVERLINIATYSMRLLRSSVIQLVLLWGYSQTSTGMWDSFHLLMHQRDDILLTLRYFSNVVLCLSGLLKIQNKHHWAVNHGRQAVPEANTAKCDAKGLVVPPWKREGSSVTNCTSLGAINKLQRWVLSTRDSQTLLTTCDGCTVDNTWNSSVIHSN